MFDEFLQHHGILGQKWGVRRFQNPDGSLTKAGKDRYSGNSIPPNTKILKNYSGPAYFISSNDSLSELNPRVPDNYFTKNGYEDSTTPRISFAPSIDKCLAGLSQNVEGNTYSVYKPVDISKHKVFKPNPKAVPDSSITDELWICEPVKLEKVGSIKVTGNRGQAGKKFTYGDKTAELYDDWIYETKEIQHSDLYLEHHGILGQKWGVRRFQNPDGSLTDAGRKRYSNGETSEKQAGLSSNQKKAIALGLAAVGTGLAIYGGIKLHNINNTYGVKEMIIAPLKDNLDYFGTSKADVKLPKGTIFQRISKEAIEDYQSRGHTYVSNTLHDNLVYRNKMPSVLGVDRPYIHRLKANTEIVAPSRRVAAETYLSLHPKATQVQYNNFMTYGIRESTDDSRSFISQLAKLGYNAIIDENDAGGKGITKQPLILLNPNISTVGTHKMSMLEKVLTMV